MAGERIVVAVGCTGFDDGARDLGGGRGVKGHVDEPWARDVHGGDTWCCGELFGDHLSELARREPGSLTELEGDVGSPVPVVTVLWSLYLDGFWQVDVEPPLVAEGVEDLGKVRGKLFWSHKASSYRG